MVKVIAAFLGSALLAFLAVFSFTARDEIGGEVERKLDDGFVEQCVARLGPQLPNPSRATDTCTCMKAEFAARGYSLTDTFGTDLPEMQSITQSCASLYS